MKRYRYKLSYNLAYVIAIVVGLGTILIFKNWFAVILEALCVCASMLGILNNLMSYICIDNMVITERNIIRKKVIDWNEVEGVIKLPTSKGEKIFIGIYGSDNQIFVTFWIHNYKDLIKSIIDKCSDTKNIWIDPRVIEILE
jgi:hypothetical protein